MADSQEDADGFQVVKKKGKRRQNLHIKKPNITDHDLDECIDVEALKVKLWQCRQELKPSEFINDLKDTWKLVKENLLTDPAIKQFYDQMNDGTGLSSQLPPGLLPHLGHLAGAPLERDPVTSIVCYGLGNFSTCIIARYQLAFLLLLSNLVHVPHSKCFCYDPRFTPSEISFLTELGLSVIDENEEGKRVCQEPTLLFMPHCGKPLYNNALWANWGCNLHHMIILGNSFSSFSERVPDTQLAAEAQYISAILPYTFEKRLKNNFKHKDIFNDMAFHTFNSVKLKQMPEGVWQRKEEPSYDHVEDLEIILKSGKT